ncbi:MAG: hypothetical protein ACPLZH_01245, partial [Minisyncoccales bacterium]
RQVVTAQQMYEGENQVFFTSTASNGVPAIGSFMPAVDDPQPGKHYTWLDNSTTPTQFCAYAVLEDAGKCSGSNPVRVFIAYEGGTRDVCV